MKTKIVVYSWGGNSAACAVALGQCLDAEVVLLKEGRPRAGSKGFALGGLQASFGAGVRLKEIPDVSDADMLILGMPVWAGSMPPAMNEFLRKTPGLSGKTVYAFATQLGPAGDIPKRLLKQLGRKVCQKGGRFEELFVLQAQNGKRLEVKDALPAVQLWAQKIRPA